MDVFFFQHLAVPMFGDFQPFSMQRLGKNHPIETTMYKRLALGADFEPLAIPSSRGHQTLSHANLAPTPTLQVKWNF